MASSILLVLPLFFTLSTTASPSSPLSHLPPPPPSSTHLQDSSAHQQLPFNTIVEAGDPSSLPVIATPLIPEETAFPAGKFTVNGALHIRPDLICTRSYVESVHGVCGVLDYNLFSNDLATPETVVSPSPLMTEVSAGPGPEDATETLLLYTILVYLILIILYLLHLL